MFDGSALKTIKVQTNTYYSMKQLFHYYMKIPRGHVWIEGDNKEISNDSRSFGPVPIGLIHGTVEARIWPAHKIQRL